VRFNSRSVSTDKSKRERENTERQSHLLVEVAVVVVRVCAIVCGFKKKTNLRQKEFHRSETFLLVLGMLALGF